MNTNEETLSNLFASKDADLLSIFEGAYDSKTRSWDYSKVTDQMLDDFERYIASKNIRAGGLGAEQLAESIRKDNSESIGKLLSGTPLTGLAEGNYQNSELIKNLRKVYSEETLAGLQKGRYNDNAISFLMAMNSAYGTGFDYTAFMSEASLRDLEDEWMSDIAQGNYVPAELTSEMGKRINKEDYAILTDATRSEEEKWEAVRRVQAARGNVT